MDDIAKRKLLRDVVDKSRAMLRMTRQADGEVYIVDCAAWNELAMAMRQLDIAEGRIDPKDKPF